MMKSFRAPQIRFVGAVLSAAFFLGSFLVLIEGYTQYRAGLQALHQMEAQVKNQRRTSQAMENYTATMDAVADFVEKARKAGMTDAAWQNFTVAIQKSMTFAEAAMVLGQAQSTDTYFFKPDSFKLTRPETEKKVAKLMKTETEQKAPDQAAAPQAGGAAQVVQTALPQQASVTQQTGTAAPPQMEAGGDLRVMVNGSFLVRRK